MRSLIFMIFSHFPRQLRVSRGRALIPQAPIIAFRAVCIQSCNNAPIRSSLCCRCCCVSCGPQLTGGLPAELDLAVLKCWDLVVRSRGLDSSGDLGLAPGFACQPRVSPKAPDWPLALRLSRQLVHGGDGVRVLPFQGGDGSRHVEEACFAQVPPQSVYIR